MAHAPYIEPLPLICPAQVERGRRGQDPVHLHRGPGVRFGAADGIDHP